MIINELFNGNDQLEKIDPKTAETEYALLGVEAAYRLPMKFGEEYVFYFEGRAGIYDFSYGKSNYKGEIKYSLTNEKIPFQILPAVIQSILMFIYEYKPITISFTGAQQRQTDFYKKLLPFLSRNLPEPYKGGYVLFSKNGPTRFVITKDTENANFKLYEDARADVSALTTAEEIATKFMQWLAKNNEEKTIDQLMFSRRLRTGKIYYANGSEFDAPDDLNIGFMYEKGKEKQSPASMFQGRDHELRQPIYFIVTFLDYDPGSDVDVLYKLRYQNTLSNLVHELTHYMDRVRQKTPTKGTFNQKVKGISPSDNKSGYFNSPLEFNAYFQQGAHAIYADTQDKRNFDPTAFDSFDKFKKHYVGSTGGVFHHNFFELLTPENKRKFDKRLFKLFNYLSEIIKQKAAA
jgi:hypothetical protein